MVGSNFQANRIGRRKVCMKKRSEQRQHEKNAIQFAMSKHSHTMSTEAKACVIWPHYKHYNVRTLGRKHIGCSNLVSEYITLVHEIWILEIFANCCDICNLHARLISFARYE